LESFHDYEEFKKLFYGLTYIDLGLYKEKQMKRRITSFVDKYGHSTYCSFFEAIRTNAELRNTFINYLTINVSEFYRNPIQWELFEKKVIPEVARHRQSITDLRIWSSACSTGEEPYTVVMLLNKLVPLERISILATDIDNEAMAKAKAGIYQSRSLKDLPPELLDRYFTKIDDEVYQISEKVRNCVNYKQLNLLRDPYPRNVDIILCRNVLIYFTEEAKDHIFAEFSKSLVKNGVLFIGSTEQIINYQRFNFKPLDTFFYQKTV
jgi:chemotaxis protein methyltransferase CheR